MRRSQIGATAGPSVSAAPADPAGRAVRLHGRSAVALTLVSAVGVAAFGWPFIIEPGAGIGHSADAPWLFALLLPLLLAIVAAEISDGQLDAKAVATLGVLAAVGTGLRVLGTGAGGVEPVFFLFVLAGRVFGAGFGFVLGQLTLLASALVTGGVGPWLPFQMLAAGWLGLGAGLLPPVRGRAEIGLLALYGAAAGLVYGLLINLWFWPFATYAGSGISFDPGAGIGQNLVRYLAFFAATSLVWDVVRAVLTAALCTLAGPPVLRALRRASRRANFRAVPQFAAAEIHARRVAEPAS
ncbi:MAG: ECF transporter S component [Jiangellaceae bacterium]|nr:ECF transporter S component [Jiangellaceae bacterium]